MSETMSSLREALVTGDGRGFSFLPYGCMYVASPGETRSREFRMRARNASRNRGTPIRLTRIRWLAGWRPFSFNFSIQPPPRIGDERRARFSRAWRSANFFFAFRHGDISSFDVFRRVHARIARLCASASVCVSVRVARRAVLGVDVCEFVQWPRIGYCCVQSTVTLFSYSSAYTSLSFS